MNKPELPHATHKGNLIIGDMKIPCFVLNDGRRLISGRGMTTAIGMKGRGQGIARIASHRMLEGNKNKKLVMAIQTPIDFTGGPPKGGVGHEATLLQELCEAILTARDEEQLKTDQEVRYGQFADMLIRAFARVGIIALVDEATGYQEVRDRIALQKILDKFLNKELAAWAKTFPDEFYDEIFRLKGWPGPEGVKRPSVLGHYTNDIVYKRLAPGVLEELKRRNPTIAPGRRKNTHTQWLTLEHGHPKLKDHLQGVTLLMRISANWEGFKRNLARGYPILTEQIPLPIEEE